MVKKKENVTVSVLQFYSFRGFENECRSALCVCAVLLGRRMRGPDSGGGRVDETSVHLLQQVHVSLAPLRPMPSPHVEQMRDFVGDRADQVVK